MDTYKDNEWGEKTPPNEYATSKSGAQREALNLPFLRQVPLEAIAAGALALEYGALKYAHRNWEKGLPWQQMIDSLHRHLLDFERGKAFDDGPTGSGLPQEAMIMASAMMLVASIVRGIGTDDRMPPVSDDALSGKECSQWIAMHLKNQRGGADAN